VLLGLAFLACGGGTSTLPPPAPPPPAPTPSAPPAPPPAPAAPAATADVVAAPPPAAAPSASLAEGTPSPDPAPPLPTVRIALPTKGALIKAADTDIKLEVKNWPTAVGGSDVHLILDNRPYKAVYDFRKPVALSELLGGAALDYGQHVLVAYPSRANGEGVKTPGALAVQEFFIATKDQGGLDLARPMLVYGDPSGDYKGEKANHILVDFQVVNDTLSDGGDHVAITVAGRGLADKLTASVSKPGTPYYLDRLPDGLYTVTLELVDKGGNLVPGPWNSTKRTISIDHAH
jgi:hypothetical protein